MKGRDTRERERGQRDTQHGDKEEARGTRPELAMVLEAGFISDEIVRRGYRVEYTRD